MATTAAKMASQAGPNFRIGGKQVFLSNAIVTLIPKRKDPNFATFQVPLTFNKLDLRDYLYHCYNVEIRSVRSFIKQSPIKSMEPGPNNQPVMVKKYRPASKKFMIVELVKPFMPPSPPEDLSSWDLDNGTALQDEHEAFAARNTGAGGNGKVRSPIGFPVATSRVLQAQQAQALRQGGVKWENNMNLDDKWREVEVGLEVAQEEKQ